MTGAFRSGWQADYPSLYNFLAPLYQTGAGSNYGRYTNTEFDEPARRGRRGVRRPRTRTPTSSRHRRSCSRTCPSSRCGTRTSRGVWADTVSNVEFGWNSVPALLRGHQELVAPRAAPAARIVPGGSGQVILSRAPRRASTRSLHTIATTMHAQKSEAA